MVRISIWFKQMMLIHWVEEYILYRKTQKLD